MPPHRNIVPLRRAATVLSLLATTHCNSEVPAPVSHDASLNEPSDASTVNDERAVDSGVDGSTTEASWRVVAADLDAPVLAVWAASDEHLFFVGERALVIEVQGSAVRRVRVPTDETLWWVWGSAANDVYAGGEAGTLLHFDGERWIKLDAGLDEQQTIWGIWGRDGSDVWIVGGRARTNGPGFILRKRGQAFDSIDAPSPSPNYYKVWGRVADEVYFVGDRSTLLRFDGRGFQSQLNAPSNAEPLFTVAGNADRVVVVGGINQGIVFELDGDSLLDVPLFTPGLNGVSVDELGQTFVVGRSGAIRRRVDGQWLTEDFLEERHYHAVIALEGGAVAVGGDLLASAEARRGLIAATGDVLRFNWLEIDAGAPGADGVDTPSMDGGGTDSGVLEDASVDSGSPMEASDAAVVPTPSERDASVSLDAAAPDAAPDAATPDEPEDAGLSLPGPAEQCDADLQCQPGLECWYILGLSDVRCSFTCESAADCGSEFGDAPRCAPAGCQTSITVCLREEWGACL